MTTPESRGLLEAILAASLDAIITIDGEGRVVGWNPAAEKTFGYQQEEVLGESMSERIIPPQWREAHQQGMKRYMQTGVARIVGMRVEVTAMRKGGETFSCEVSFHPIRLPEGMFFTAYLRDLTEQKRVERELRDLSEAQTRFVADVSHEIKTPIAGILVYLEVLWRYRHMPEEEQLEVLDDCLKEARRLGRLVSDLLGLSNGQSLQMVESELRLDVLVKDTLRTLAATRQDILLEAGPLEFCRVLGDQDRLQQLLVILVGNALKYTPAGGRVMVQAQCEALGVCLKISDTGVGIPAADLTRVFERFYRSDHSRLGHDPGGTGLGLAIARWIVEAHGGTIHLESEVGKGTTAVVCLPHLKPDHGGGDGSKSGNESETGT